MDERKAEAAGEPVEEVRGRFESQIPLGRYGEPEEHARVAAFLASPANTRVQKHKTIRVKVLCFACRRFAKCALEAHITEGK
jgi:NAD(P)-dependent dehydrogenase (short-subunit alcohol dehydrogenase family)